MKKRCSVLNGIKPTEYNTGWKDAEYRGLCRTRFLFSDKDHALWLPAIVSKCKQPIHHAACDAIHL